jgi:outer membrane lipoprotein-sorting protein
MLFFSSLIFSREGGGKNWYSRYKEEILMKKILAFSVLVVFLMTLAVSPGFAQSINRILKKMIDAQGGRKTIESIKDITMTGRVEMPQQGISGIVTIYKKEPDKRRIDLDAMGIIITQVYDGQRVVWTDPQTGDIEDMDEQQAASMIRQSLPITAIIDPEKYGVTITYKGKETVDGKECFMLEQVYRDGYRVIRYVDSDTHLSVKSRSTITGPGGSEIQVEQVMSDFRKVDGMTMAYSITTYYNGSVFNEIRFKGMKFNTGLEDSLFQLKK